MPLVSVIKFKHQICWTELVVVVVVVVSVISMLVAAGRVTSKVITFGWSLLWFLKNCFFWNLRVFNKTNKPETGHKFPLITFVHSKLVLTVWYHFYLPSRTEITCPALPTVSVGTYFPATCDDGTAPAYTFCRLTCPSGYHISYYPVDVASDTRTCLSNGTWEYRETVPSCKGRVR